MKLLGSAAVDAPSYAELEHGARHPREAFGAVAHALKHFLLVLAQGAQLFVQHEPAIPGQGRQRCAKIVHGTRQERGSILVIFLQQQVCQEQ